jgi:hypothetical protein
LKILQHQWEQPLKDHTKPHAGAHYASNPIDIITSGVKYKYLATRWRINILALNSFLF